LVGIARHDGENAAGKIIEYLKTEPEKGSLHALEIEALLESKGLHPVNKSDLLTLARVEEREARARKLISFKYSDNSEMLNAIAEKKAVWAANVSLAARQPWAASEASATESLEAPLTRC
jgi:hypothetical protein